MSRKPLGPVPNWLASANEESGKEADPLKSIFSESRSTRLGMADEAGDMRGLVDERAGAISTEATTREIRLRLKDFQEPRGGFSTVYAAPTFGNDVLDEPSARLVILGPGAPHSAGVKDSKARRAARTLLEKRGAGPRLYRDSLFFVAPDADRQQELEYTVRQYLAWKSIAEEWMSLNLDSTQGARAKAQRDVFRDRITERISGAYEWLLAPISTASSIDLAEYRIAGDAPLAIRATDRLTEERRLTARSKPRRFHGAMYLDAGRFGRDSARLQKDVLDLLVKAGGNVRVTVTVDVHIPDGADESTARNVTENCRALNFTTHSFEEADED